ncbi:MAG: translation initiation factor IF-2 [Aggregatilineales bacterium]
MAKEQQVILVPDYITVRELAELIDASPIEVMKKLIANGIMASINQQIDFDTAAIVIEEMGFEAQSESAIVAAQAAEERAANSTQTWRTIYADENPDDLITRPPVVTILGHVDHGKTTLLDTIRNAHVVDGEAGGITQHIGAYRAYHNGRQITFLDTPGHEAFTAMRARGAQGADIAVLVVAADDGVMPTTREALDHARAANVPIVVAITKVDKRNSSVETVKQGLAELELIADDWDGDTLMVPVAALKGEGIEDLLEAILLVADDTRIVANPNADAGGIVVESEVDKTRGTMATLLVLNGTLKRGDTIVAGEAYGRIKAMFDEAGKPVQEASSSSPVAVLGLNGTPQPGDRFEFVKNEKEARSIVDGRISDAQEIATGGGRSFTLEDVFAQFAAGETKELNLIIKADVQGSLEPIINELKALSGKNREGIGIRILSSSIGNVSENDVMLASSSSAIIIAFNVDVDNASRKAAESQHVDIRKYTIIYKLLESINLALEGMLEPVYEPKTIGVAEVRQVFNISRGNIAGCYVTTGEIKRGGGTKVRVMRRGQMIAENRGVASLKRIKDDVREVRQGFECGISLDGFNDFEEGDHLEFYVMERTN